MALLRVLTVTLAVSVFAAACSSDSSAAGVLSVTDYSARLVEIFESENTPDMDFPVGGESVQVAGIFMAVEAELSKFKSLRPPPEVEVIHAELIERFDSVQEAVADYLQHHGVEGGEITLFDVAFDAEISRRLRAAHESCETLRVQLFDLDAPLPGGWCPV